MSLLPVQGVPLFVLLLGVAAPAQSHPALASPPVRSLELPPLRGVAEVSVAPGLPTTLLFNAELDRGAVERAGRELGFARIGVTEDMLVVVPAQEAQPGARLTIPIRFAGEEAREAAAVVFVVDPARAEAYVQVVRRVRTVPALEEALAAALERGTALEAALETRSAKLATVRAEKASMVALIEAGVLGHDGIRTVKLGAVEWDRPGDGTANAWLYVAAGRVAFDIELTLAAHARPWAPGKATLTPERKGASPIPARVARLLGTGVLAPGETAHLLVEFEVPAEGATKGYRLEIQEQEGGRMLRRANVKLAAPAARKQ
ncbi:MAG TPA: DUF2381 family protein [Hyalangium sp.]|nr:DUF2381 family protein [Hyalangium sp.]